MLADQCALALAHTLGLREPSPAGTWHLGDMEIDPAGNRVVIAGRPVHLTPSEFHMLVLLAEEPGKLPEPQGAAEPPVAHRARGG